MVSFYEAFEKERSSDISHHGVKGMKWGVRKQKLYSPAKQSYSSASENDSRYSSYYDIPAKNIQEASHQKVVSTKKKVMIGLGIGLGVAGTITGILLGVRHNKNKISADDVLTSAGADLKKEIGGL